MSYLNNIPTKGTWTNIQSILTSNFQKLMLLLQGAENIDISVSGTTITVTDKDGVKHTFNAQGNSGYSGAADELEVVNNLTSGGSTSALSAEQGKVLKGLVDEKASIDSGSDSDLDIVDESGNVIARFANGHIKTKNFDSSNNNTDHPIQTSSYNDDFCIADESGNVLTKFSEGHISTKNFKSKDFAKKPYQRLTYFTINVDGNNPTSDNEATKSKSYQFTKKTYTDNACLMLPTTYKASGTKTRLVIIGKAGGNKITSSTNSILTSGGWIKIPQYLCYLGYAVLMVDGTPDAWATELGIEDGYCNGNYIAIQSTKKAYDYVVENYNIREDGVFGVGFSQGGWNILNVADLSGIPFIGMALKSPMVSLRWQHWDLGDGTTYSNRNKLAKALGIFSTQDEVDSMEYPTSKIAELDPYNRYAVDRFDNYVADATYRTYGGKKLATNVVFDDISMRRYSPYPIKVWVANNDKTLPYPPTQVFVKALRNNGCKADICTYSDVASSSSHELTTTSSIGTFTENGVSNTLYALTYNIAAWLYQLGGIEPTI